MARAKTEKKTKWRERKPVCSFLAEKLLGGTLHHYGNELSERHGWLFTHSFERVFDSIRIDPDKIEKMKHFAAKGRIIYALPHQSPLDFLFLNCRLRFSGLPMPEIAYNTNLFRFQPLRKLLRVPLARVLYLLTHGGWPNPFKNKYYLRRYREGAGFVLGLDDPASFVKRLIYPIHDPIYHLIKLHRKHNEPIIIMPIFPVFEKGASRHETSVGDIFLGPKDRPGRLRKIVHYLRFSSQAFLEVGDPVTISRFLEREDQRGLTDEEIAFNLRKELWDHSMREQRVIRGPELVPRTRIMEEVLRDPDTIKVMRQESKRQQKTFRVIRKQSAKYMNEIAADYSPTTIEFLDRALGWVWKNLYDGVNVDQESLAKVREAAKRHPLVYVPSHKSHIDYLILSWVLYNHNMVPPHIVAGVNLNTWPIGPIFRKGGAFFMRRSFRDNPLYRAIFTKYVEVLIKGGYNIEFFIEGGRSRTGRLLMPTLGMVKYVNAAWKHGAAKDVMFVPTYIGHDQILEEGEYLEEMAGTKNPKGNLFELLRNRNLIRRRYGRIYLNFGTPISLRAHTESLADKGPDDPLEHENYVVQEMAGQVIQSINRKQVVTPFSLMAAALLTSPHKAIGHSELVNALALYYQYLLEAGAYFSETLDNFTRATEEVIDYYERRKHIEVEREEGEEPIYALPESDRLSLDMYKNMIIHHFLPISFVSLSLLASEYGECSDYRIYEDYMTLKDLLQSDFIYDEKSSDQDNIEKALDFLERGRHLALQSKNGDRHFTVTQKGREEMVYYAAMLTNFLEAYSLVFNNLPMLEKQESEKDFLTKLSKKGQRLLKQGMVLRPEALSQLLFKNALAHAADLGMIERAKKGKLTLLSYNQDKEDLRKQILFQATKFIRVEKYHYLSRS